MAQSKLVKSIHLQCPPISIYGAIPVLTSRRYDTGPQADYQPQSPNTVTQTCACMHFFTQAETQHGLKNRCARSHVYSSATNNNEKALTKKQRPLWRLALFPPFTSHLVLAKTQAGAWPGAGTRPAWKLPFQCEVSDVRRFFMLSFQRIPHNSCVPSFLSRVHWTPIWMGLAQ